MKPVISKRTAISSMGGLMLVSLFATGLGLMNAASQQPARADFAQEERNPVSLDESVAETFGDRFSLDNALNRLEQIQDALSSFSQLTQKSEPVLGEDAIAEVGNTGWETQNLGFPNWTGAVEGTLRKQHYQIQKLELELAEKQYEDGEISQQEFEEKEAAYQRAEQEFDEFWDSFQIAD